MKSRLFSATFDVQIHNTNKGNFNIPKKICDLFNLDDSTSIDFSIDDMNGNIASFNKKPTSGQEVQLGKHIYNNEQIIRVTVYNPNY